ncbi:hypothetical protein [Cytobacillus oceanisediminis]|uniref:hypothetical protein n=1 Tax=Cytobacillus oceanisediminis TaxID=665099 RepID=UPI00119E014C|nr:hypothetical protein [Cytobacillus oceanisediminis]
MKYWLASIVLIVVSVLFLKQGMDLWKLGTDVDGDGMGIHFLGFLKSMTAFQKLVFLLMPQAIL